MFREKCANGKYAGKRMKLSKEITGIRLGFRCGHALSAAEVHAGSNCANPEERREIAAKSV
jgi:hypothetical protein